MIQVITYIHYRYIIYDLNFIVSKRVRLRKNKKKLIYAFGCKTIIKIKKKKTSKFTNLNINYFYFVDIVELVFVMNINKYVMLYVWQPPK